MKKHMFVLLIAGGLGLCALHAQNSATPVGAPVPASVEGSTTPVASPAAAIASSNPFSAILNNAVHSDDSRFANESFQLRLGTEQLGLNGTGYGASIGGSWHATKLMDVEGKVVSGNVGGALYDVLIGTGISKSAGNYQFTGFMLGGYDCVQSKAEGEGGLRIAYLPSLSSNIGAYVEGGIKVVAGGRTKEPGSFLNAGLCYSF